jgi:hypothetical protein
MRAFPEGAKGSIPTRSRTRNSRDDDRASNPECGCRYRRRRVPTRESGPPSGRWLSAMVYLGMKRISISLRRFGVPTGSPSLSTFVAPGVVPVRPASTVVLEVAEAVLAYLRDPKTAESLRLDPRRITSAGHSLGGGATVEAAAYDHALVGAVLISAEQRVWAVVNGTSERPLLRR